VGSSVDRIATDFLSGFARNFIAFLDVIRQGRGPSPRCGL